MDEDLEGLNTYDQPITYRASKKVAKRLKDEARKRGHKPGPYARYLLEIALGFRNPEPAIEFPYIPYIKPLSKKKDYESVGLVAQVKRITNLTDYVAKTIITAGYIPDNIPYTAICFRNSEGDCLAFYNKPEFVFPAPEEKVKMLPIHKAFPKPTGEAIMESIRGSLRGKTESSRLNIPRGNQVHTMERTFSAWTEEVCMIMLRNVAYDRQSLRSIEISPLARSVLYKRKVWLAPTDPLIVFWINKDFLIFDARYQRNIMLMKPETQFCGPIKIEEELPEKEARIVEGAITRALEAQQPVHYRIELLKQCCLCTEDVWTYPIATDVVMNTIRHVRSICLKHEHQSTYFGIDVDSNFSSTLPACPRETSHKDLFPGQ